MLAAPPPHRPIYIDLVSPRPVPTNMRQHSTPQGRQFKPMDVPRNDDLVELWVDIPAASLPPSRWSTLPTRPSFRGGLYRRICASIVHPRAVNLSLWTSLAMKIWWSYGLTCSLLPPPHRPIYIDLVSPRPVPTNMRQHSTPQGRQFKPMDVPRNEDLVELWADRLAVLPSPPKWTTLPTSSPFDR
jgi:hypothetical protein